MTFRVGQKVVCVNDTPPTNGRPLQVKKGEVYTVARSFDWFGEEGLLFDEIAPGAGVGWHAWRFRPVTDISFAHEILRKASKPARGPAFSSPQDQTNG
jgi:hypothetical protein